MESQADENLRSDAATGITLGLLVLVSAVGIAIMGKRRHSR